MPICHLRAQHHADDARQQGKPHLRASVGAGTERRGYRTSCSDTERQYVQLFFVDWGMVGDDNSGSVFAVDRRVRSSQFTIHNSRRYRLSSTSSRSPAQSMNPCGVCSQDGSTIWKVSNSVRRPSHPRPNALSGPFFFFHFIATGRRFHQRPRREGRQRAPVGHPSIKRLALGRASHIWLVCPSWSQRGRRTLVLSESPTSTPRTPPCHALWSRSFFLCLI